MLRWFKVNDKGETSKSTSFLSKIPSLTKYVIASMVAIILFTAIYLWFIKSFAITIPTEVCNLWYGYWGSELFVCAGLRTGKWIVNRKNPFTGEGGTIGGAASNSGSDSDDAVG